MKENSEKELESCSSVNDIVEFVKKKAVTHDFYYHFTNIDSVLAILESRKWRLSSVQAMNDQQEREKGEHEMWRKTFVASFSFGDEDNFAMWERYGKPQGNAVRLTIKKEKIVGLAKRITKVLVQKDTYAMIDESFCSDVAYFYGYVRGKGDQPGKKLLWHNMELDLEKKGLGTTINNDQEMTGILKNSAWKHEDECRLLVRTKDKLSCDHVYVTLPQDFFAGTKLFLGPFFTLSEKNKQKIITLSEQGNMSIENSYFKGQRVPRKGRQRTIYFSREK